MKQRMKKILFLVWIIVLLVTASQIVRLTAIYQESSQEYEQYASSYVKPNPSSSPKPESADPGAQENKAPQEAGDLIPQPPITVDFPKIQKENPQIIGWIYLEGTQISYPIVQGSDNQYYLNHTVEGKKNAAGAIFLDYQNHSDFTDPNSIVYGHNMRNGSMFRKLREYLIGDAYAKSPYFWILTPQENQRYQIRSAFVAKVNSFPYTLFSAFDASYQEFLKEMEEASQIDIQAEPLTGKERTVTLSTCNGEGSTRVVVMGCSETA